MKALRLLSLSGSKRRENQCQAEKGQSQSEPVVSYRQQIGNQHLSQKPPEQYEKNCCQEIKQALFAVNRPEIKLFFISPDISNKQYQPDKTGNEQTGKHNIEPEGDCGKFTRHLRLREPLKFTPYTKAFKEKGPAALAVGEYDNTLSLFREGIIHAQ